MKSVTIESEHIILAVGLLSFFVNSLTSYPFFWNAGVLLFVLSFTIDSVKRIKEEDYDAT